MTEKRFTIQGIGISNHQRKRLYDLQTVDGFISVRDVLNELNDENEHLKKENQEVKAILQDMGMLLTDKEVKDIRDEIADELLKPMFKSNGFDVDINTDDGFTIIPKGDV